jgi:phospholipid transport system substrate-binding protein
MTAPITPRALVASFLFLLLLAPAFGSTSLVLAGQLSEPQQVVEKVSDGLVRILREQRDRLQTDPDYVYEVVDDLFLPNVDMQGVSALVLGRHWRTASPHQKDAFNREFTRLVTQTYATAITELSDGWDIVFLPTRELSGSAERVLVRTQVARPGGSPTSVDYSMRHAGGRWLAYDVKVEGVSLLTNYRSSFARLISQKGLDGLIQDLAARNDAREDS